jgi:ribonucleoside-triphosphate reductase
MKVLSTGKKQPERVIPCTIFSRVVGYLVPVSAWNIGKKEEFKDRRVYKVGQDDLGD